MGCPMGGGGAFVIHFSHTDLKMTILKHVKICFSWFFTVGKTVSSAGIEKASLLTLVMKQIVRSYK